MATGENWQQGMISEVYYPYGRFNHDQGKKRFVRAPFVLIKWDPNTPITKITNRS